MNRGDVVIVDLRPHDPNAKVRPAVVVQNDRDNARMNSTIIVIITSVIHRVGEATQLLIDSKHADWQSSGLRLDSVVNCSNIFTIKKQHIVRVIGSLSVSTMSKINDCVRAALQMP